MERVASFLGVRFTAQPGLEPPPRLIGPYVGLEALAQPMHQPSRRLRGRVCRLEHFDRIGEPERSNHGRRVRYVASGDEVLEQRKTGIVQGDVR